MMTARQKERSLEAFTDGLEKLRYAANIVANVCVVGPNQDELDSIFNNFEKLEDQLKALQEEYKNAPVRSSKHKTT